MASIGQDERYNEKRRQLMLSELSHLGVDDELLRDVLMKIKERRARNHPSPTLSPSSRSYRNGSGHDVAQMRSPRNADKTLRYTIDPCCMTLRCFETLGKGSKSRQNRLIAYESANEPIPERFSSEHPQRSRSTSRNTQSSASSRKSPRLNPDFQSSKTDRRHADSAWVKPAIDTSGGSPSHEMSLRANRSFASNSRRSKRSSRVAHYSSNPAEMSPKLNPIIEAPSVEESNLSREARGDRHVSRETRDDRHPTRETRDDRSIDRRGWDANPSSLGSPSNGLSSRSVASPARSTKSGRSKQGSKASGIKPNRNPTISIEEPVCPGCAAKHGGPHEHGANATRRSMGTAQVQNKQGLKSAGKQSTTKPKMTLSRMIGLGPTAKQGGLNPIESQVKHTCKPHGSQSRSHAIKNQEAVPRRSLQEAPTMKSSSNGLSRQSQASLASTKESVGSPRSTGESRKSTSKGRRSSSKSRRSSSKSRRSKSKSHRSTSKSRGSNSKSEESISRTQESNSTSRESNSKRKVKQVEAAKTSASPRDLGYVGGGQKGRRRRFDSAADSVSTLSLPSHTSTAFTKNSIIAREDFNPAHPGNGHSGYQDADGDGSSQESHAISGEVGKVVDTIRSTTRDVLASDVENVWLSRDVLREIAESKDVSVEALIERVCDKLENLDDETLFLLEEKKAEPGKAAKPWFPRVHLSVKW